MAMVSLEMLENLVPYAMSSRAEKHLERNAMIIISQMHVRRVECLC